MDEKASLRIKMSFPGDLEYVSSIRKFISEVLIVNNYSQKFAYRTEVIVDEICSNAVNYGCKTVDAQIELICLIFADRIEMRIKDQGGGKEDIERLRIAVKSGEDNQNEKANALRKPYHDALGLEIVRMLSEEIDLQIDDNNITTIRVMRKRKPIDNA